MPARDATLPSQSIPCLPVVVAARVCASTPPMAQKNTGSLSDRHHNTQHEQELTVQLGNSGYTERVSLQLRSVKTKINEN